jgi:hypothetical protein
VLWKKLELLNLHICKKKFKGEIFIWNPKVHQHNTTREYQQATIQHNKRMSMSKKSLKGANKTQHVNVDKHQ